MSEYQCMGHIMPGLPPMRFVLYRSNAGLPFATLLFLVQVILMAMKVGLHNHIALIHGLAILN